MRLHFLMLMLLGMSFLTACVTINIYFPAEETRRAADKIIDKILDQPAAPPAAPSVKKEAS